MKILRPLALMVIAAGFSLAPADKAQAQVAVSNGEAPVRPYGYHEAPPYNCAPDGYYGPEWFGGGGIFIGAGAWYHGSGHFYGHVDHQLDYRATTGGSQRAALLQQNIAQSFKVRQA